MNARGSLNSIQEWYIAKNNAKYIWHMKNCFPTVRWLVKQVSLALTHCGVVAAYDGTKPLPEPVLTLAIYGIHLYDQFH